MCRQKPKPVDESFAALADAHEGLKKAQERGPEVTHVSGLLRLLRDENHFSQQLQELFERKGHHP